MQTNINNILDRFVDDLDNDCFIDTYAMKRSRIVFGCIKNLFNKEVPITEESRNAFEPHILTCNICNKQIDKFSLEVHYKTCATKECWKCIYKEYRGKELKVIFSQKDIGDQLVRIFDLEFLIKGSLEKFVERTTNEARAYIGKHTSSESSLIKRNRKIYFQIKVDNKELKPGMPVENELTLNNVRKRKKPYYSFTLFQRYLKNCFFVLRD